MHKLMPTGLIGSVLRAGAYAYYRIGWTAVALGLDTSGLPKRPLATGWPTLTCDWKVIDAQPWRDAKGLGLVLGPASANLAVLDIDDVELAELALRLCSKTRRINTIRHRAHIYFIEEQPSASRRLTVEWAGRPVTVELKTTGTQVAAPPTPGYTHACDRDLMPVKVESIQAAWDALAPHLGISDAAISSGQASPWTEKVPKDNRNNTMYVEAHRLREAGVHLDAAVTMLRARWEQDYEHGDQGWGELERTIRSAYRKPVLEGVADGRDTYQLWTGRLPRDAGGTKP